MDIPQKNKYDLLHTGVKTIINLLPGIGGSINEVFNAFITPPIEKRREKWMQNVVNLLNKLEENQKDTIKRLTNDDEFISLLILASKYALQTHLESKHKMLIQSLSNSLVRKIAFDVKETFIHLINDLSIVHIQILHFIVNNKQNIQEITEAKELYTLFKEKITEIENVDLFAFQYFLKDLETKGLLIISSSFDLTDNQVREPKRLTSGFVNEKLGYIEISNLGMSFLSFINN